MTIAILLIVIIVLCLVGLLATANNGSNVVDAEFEAAKKRFENGENR